METRTAQQLLIRRLPADEFPKLKTLYDGFCPPAETSIVFIAEEGQEIVGRSMLLAPVHLEGPWVTERKRGTNLAFRLVREAERAAKEIGLTKIFAFAINPGIEDYLMRIGYQRNTMTLWEKGI